MTASAWAPLSWKSWWRRHSRAEQRSMAALAVMAVLVLALTLAWLPLQQSLARERAAQAREQAALAAARAEASAIAAAQGNAVATVPARDAAETLLERQGVRAQAQRVAWEGPLLRLTFDRIAFDRLLATLSALHREAHLAVHEAVVSARVEPGLVRAELTLGP